ncbi:hypothetical protein H4R35_005946 [Dimargaris xerosporica]|nr:hypothetical protein H4R35_005946 [Dimargaris xerosporica]
MTLDTLAHDPRQHHSSGMPETAQAPIADPLLRFSNAYFGHVHSHNPTLLRAGLLPSDRIATVAWVTSLWGFGIGAYMGGRKAGLQYFAEHMHKLPKTHQGWYFYHKHKNYRVMLGGIKRGLAYAARFTAVSGAFTATETALDLWKGDTDFTSTLFAAFTTAYGFATLSKLPCQSFRYVLKIGLLSGLFVGLAQDVLHAYQDRPPFYVDWWRKNCANVF